MLVCGTPWKSTHTPHGSNFIPTQIFKSKIIRSFCRYPPKSVKILFIIPNTLFSELMYPFYFVCEW